MTRARRTQRRRPLRLHQMHGSSCGRDTQHNFYAHHQRVVCFRHVSSTAAKKATLAQIVAAVCGHNCGKRFNFGQQWLRWILRCGRGAASAVDVQRVRLTL